MEKLTVLVKGDIYCKECGCIKRGGSATSRVDPNNYPNPSLIIEGDLTIDGSFFLDEGIRLVATGLIHMRGLCINPSKMTCNGLSYMSAKHISAKGNFNG